MLKPTLISNKTKKKKDEGEEIPATPDTVQRIAIAMSQEEALRAGGIYYINGEIIEGSLQSIQHDIILKHYIGPQAWKGDLQLIINTPGGDISETNALLDILDNVRMDVRTVGIGQCCSAGAQLLAAGTKGKRIVGPNTQIMVHCYSWGAIGNHHDLVASRDAQDQIYQQEIEFWIKHSKYKTKALVEKNLLRKNDTWLTAKMALEHGIVDVISTTPFDKAAE